MKYYESPWFVPQPGRDYTPEGSRDGSPARVVASDAEGDE